MGVELACYWEENGQTHFIGFYDFVTIFDLRVKKICREFKFNVSVALDADADVNIVGASQYLTWGTGQADIRPITHADGTPYFEDNKLWLLVTCRGDGFSVTTSVSGGVSFTFTGASPTVKIV